MKVFDNETLESLLWPASPGGVERRNLLAKVRWSYSRRTALEQCPRRYYYEYYGASARLASGDGDKATLRRLKALQNRHERAGTIVHLVISTYFRKAQSGEVWEPDRLCKWALGIFRKDWAYSRADPDGVSQPREHFPPVLLHEYYYRHSNAAAVCSETENRLAEAIHTFATSPRFAEFRVAGVVPGSLVEYRVTLQGLPCNVEGKLDLAYATASGGVIVDWKLGVSSDKGIDSLQLGTYALCGSHHFAAAPERISVYKAFLTSEEAVQFPVDDGVLANCRSRILQDAERMAAMQGYGERGIVEAFAPHATAAVCSMCPFKQVCPEGRAVLHA